MRPTTRRRPSIRRASARAFRPSRTATCTSATRRASALNFGLAREYGGVCHLRFDDTNPEKEEQEYVDSILDAVQWLGFGWTANGVDHLYYASDYFDFMYRAAEALIEAGHAYVDEQIGRARCAPTAATSTRPARPARSATARPRRTWRAFARCATASTPTARWCCARRSTWPRPTSTCATRPSTASSAPTHHSTGDKLVHLPDVHLSRTRSRTRWSSITHSICTLEFEDQRPFYDWLLDTLAEAGPAGAAAAAPVRVRAAEPHLRHHQQAQAEGSWSTRSIVEGWDDPRMPTIVGLRRRGYTPEAIRLMCRARRRQQGRRLDRLREAGHRAARRPGRQGAARDGRARPGEARR